MDDATGVVFFPMFLTYSAKPSCTAVMYTFIQGYNMSTFQTKSIRYYFKIRFPNLWKFGIQHKKIVLIQTEVLYVVL